MKSEATNSETPLTDHQLQYNVSIVLLGRMEGSSQHTGRDTFNDFNRGENRIVFFANKRHFPPFNDGVQLLTTKRDHLKLKEPC